MNKLPSIPQLIELAQEVGIALQARQWLLTTAESCTGGWVAQTITDVSGSSQWFERGFVTYSNQAKQDMLGVKSATLLDYGAVSEETAREMAEGAITHSLADISVAITGIAGPGGGSVEKPVGTVWLAWAGKYIPTQISKYQYSGDRYMIRLQATQQALEGILITCKQIK